MSVRDDYPAVAILHDAWTSRDRTGETPPQAVQMLDEIESLRRWKAEASAVLDEWEGVWMVAGQPRGPGLPSISKAQGVAREIQRLRSYCAAWMNGVADAVEQFGYDRRAASGPADLLPGLTTLVDQRNDLWERVCELETRLERHPVTTGGAGTLDPGLLSFASHRLIPQSGANVCVCGEWFDAAVHQVTSSEGDLSEGGEP